MRKSALKRRHASLVGSLIGCLLVVVILILSPSSTRATDLDGNANAETSPPTLLSSLWQTFKQTMEMTTSALSHKTAAQEEPDHLQNARNVLSRRRIALVQKTLQDHYTQQLVDSSPHLDNYHSTPEQEEEQAYVAAKIESNARQANRRPLRWKEGKESGCYFFSESSGDYWSFQWCPRGIVMQGFRTKENRLNVQHLLGSFVSFLPSGSTTAGKRDYAQQFALEAQLRYPNSQQLELYHNGDPCGKQTAALPSNRRTTVVLLHERTSRFCAGDWADGLMDLAIESVEEPQECRYLIHVCGPSPNAQTTTAASYQKDKAIEKLSTTKRKPITQSDANQLNQTITQIQQSLRTYLRESSADTRRKTNPDRTTSLHVGLPPLPQSRIQSNLKLLQNMFQHAYDSYMYNAFPASDIKPMTCQPASFNLVRIPGLTLIDSLDTLVVFGNYTEFARAVERLRGLHQHLQEETGGVNGGGGLFALNQNVSVFETNIRVLGGLLSAHQMAEAYLSRKVLKQDVWSTKDKTVLVGPITTTAMPEMECPVSDDDDDNDNDEFSDVDQTVFPKQCSVTSSLLECESSGTTTQPKATTCRNATLKFWEYDGILLELAQDIGDRLLPAFETMTGIPYGTVNLLSGIPRGETTIASLAGGGTLSLEMELLSRLTGNTEYGKAAKLATRALWMRRSELGLVGKHICTHRGEWTETLSGIGSNSDSFYEYLIKHHTLFPEDYDFWLQLVSTYGGIYNESRLGEWYGDVDYSRGQSKGGSARRVFEALMAFYPGMQVLLGELAPAGRSLNSFFLIREHLGFLPERFNYAFWKVDTGGGRHFLRPELLESAYFQHQASKGFQQQFRNSSIADSSGWQWAADFALHAIEDSTKTICGYASLKAVSPTTTGDIRRQGRIKSTDNLMNEMPSFFLSETLKYLYLIFDENNVLHTDKDRDWVFTTEAHPIHHVDAPREGQKVDELDDLNGRLVKKLQARIQGTNPGRTTSNRYENDKWTVSSSSQNYFEQAVPIALDVDKRSRSQLIASERASHGPDFWQTTHIVQPLVSASQVFPELDFFHETQQKQNAAHLTFGRLGNQLWLTNSCPNFYLSDWRWICALNGGGVDYSDAYVSSTMDKPAPGESQFLMLGSIDALAFYGSGVHVAELYDKSRKCPIVQRQEQSTDTGTSSPEEVELQKEVFDMGGELGKFEVTAFPEGSGFFLERLSSGETLAVTLIYDETSKEPEKPYVMVYASTPVNAATEEHEAGDESGTEVRDYVERSVVMADVAGNAFSCQVEVSAKYRLAFTAMEDGSLGTCIDGKEEYCFKNILGTYPCAPAMFGPAHLVELADRDGIMIESTSIRRPNTGGGFGCQTSSTEAADDSETNIAGEGSAGSINLVHRGVCTFEQKALIQKNNFDAEAVIVINSEEDELFVMSGGGSGHPWPLTSSDFPTTVLVTGADGKDLFFLMKSMEMDKDFELSVRISVTRDQVDIVEKNKQLSVQNNLFWPAVRANPNAVQIFAKGGWAVHAVQRNADKKNAAAEWQLFLLRHDSFVQPEAEL